MLLTPLKLVAVTGLIFSSCVMAGTKNQAGAPVVEQIYPTSDALPSNILRFYIQFSQPMQEMDALKHIHLSDELGNDLTGVFFENQYELWSPDRTKLTLIVDPGRVKTGLQAHEQMGRAFVSGKRYQLRVDTGLLNFNDQTLAAPFIKTFTAVGEDRQPPQLDNWQVTVPKARTETPLLINFNEPLDHISAGSLIKVVRDDQIVEGSIQLLEHETVWQFTPNRSWQAGDYQIVVHPQLEDVAANSLNLVFDHKPEQSRQAANQTQQRNFVIR